MFSLVSKEWVLQTGERQQSLHLPADSLLLILELSRDILIRIKTKFHEIIAPKLFESLHKYFEVITEQDVEINSLVSYMKVLRQYDLLRNDLPPSLTGLKLLDVNEVAIIVQLKFLRSKVFEKKFKAINLLTKRMIDFKQKEEIDQNVRNLLKYDILKILYIDGYHREIARKSNKLLSFIVPKLSSKTLIELLKAAFEQGEEKTEVICFTIRNILKDLEIEVILF